MDNGLTIKGTTIKGSAIKKDNGGKYHSAYLTDNGR